MALIDSLLQAYNDGSRKAGLEMMEHVSHVLSSERCCETGDHISQSFSSYLDDRRAETIRRPSSLLGRLAFNVGYNFGGY